MEARTIVLKRTIVLTPLDVHDTHEVIDVPELTEPEKDRIYGECGINIDHVIHYSTAD